MAKRRRLDAPSPADLADLETGFAAKPVAGFAAPISQVAAEAARLTQPLPPAERAAVAGADALRKAEEEGRLIREIPLDAIVTEHLVRDRMVVSGPEMEELKASIRLNGQRLPVEVVALDEGRYGLISGWRRVTALRALAVEEGAAGTVKALVRPAQATGAAYAAMIEENELREQLSPYERGRIAVVAADQGVFVTPDQAVDAIFATASKAKRSKIRSFAMIHEELGDMLSFPTDLSERSGLRIAHALRMGFAAKLREALASGMGVDAAGELAVMEPVLAEAEAATREPSRGGRPKRERKAAPKRPGSVPLANGVIMERVAHEDGFSIRLRGRNVDGEFIDTVMREIERLLEPI